MGGTCRRDLAAAACVAEAAATGTSALRRTRFCIRHPQAAVGSESLACQLPPYSACLECLGHQCLSCPRQAQQSPYQCPPESPLHSPAAPPAPNLLGVCGIQALEARDPLAPLCRSLVDQSRPLRLRLRVVREPSAHAWEHETMCQPVNGWATRTPSGHAVRTRTVNGASKHQSARANQSLKHASVYGSFIQRVAHVMMMRLLAPRHLSMVAYLSSCTALMMRLLAPKESTPMSMRSSTCRKECSRGVSSLIPRFAPEIHRWIRPASLKLRTVSRLGSKVFHKSLGVLGFGCEVSRDI